MAKRTYTYGPAEKQKRHERFLATREATRLQCRKYRLEHPEETAEASRRWRQAHIDEVRARNRERMRKARLADPEAARAKDRANYAANIERERQQAAARRKANPEYFRALGRKYRSRPQCQEKQKIWREEHHDEQCAKRREYMRDRRRLDPVATRERDRAYYAANAERIQALVRARIEADPEGHREARRKYNQSERGREAARRGYQAYAARIPDGYALMTLGIKVSDAKNMPQGMIEQLIKSQREVLHAKRAVRKVQ